MSKLVKMVLAMVVLGSLASCQRTTPKIVFKYGELRFVVMPDPTTPLAEVDVRYEVGSREDPPGKAGLAHLVEHLMFQQRPDGPHTRPLMQVLGQLTLNMNAYTNWDTTHYMLNARAELLDPLVKIEAMRMYYGCQTISEAEFLREREVVRNEIRGTSRSPEDLIPRLTLSAIYPRGHAYAQMIGGDDEQLSATAAIANAFAAYLGDIAPVLGSGAGRFAAITASVWGLAVLNVFGVRGASSTVNLLTVAKLVPLLVFVGAGVVFVDPSRIAFFALPQLGSLRQAALLLVFAYGGFENANVPTEEALNPAATCRSRCSARSPPSRCSTC